MIMFSAFFQGKLMMMAAKKQHNERAMPTRITARLGLRLRAF
ncbi:MAG: hypothetical protein ACJAZP_002801 [Psychromonas sp.]|jgi:hypothetical protein